MTSCGALDYIIAPCHLLTDSRLGKSVKEIRSKYNSSREWAKSNEENIVFPADSTRLVTPVSAAVGTLFFRKIMLKSANIYISNPTKK